MYECHLPGCYHKHITDFVAAALLLVDMYSTHRLIVSVIVDYHMLYTPVVVVVRMHKCYKLYILQLPHVC